MLLTGLICIPILTYFPKRYIELNFESSKKILNINDPLNNYRYMYCPYGHLMKCKQLKANIMNALFVRDPDYFQSFERE